MVEPEDISRVLDELTSRLEHYEKTFPDKTSIERWAELEHVSEMTLAFIAHHGLGLFVRSLSEGVDEGESPEDGLVRVQSMALTMFAIGWEAGRQYGSYSGTYSS